MNYSASYFYELGVFMENIDNYNSKERSKLLKSFDNGFNEVIFKSKIKSKVEGLNTFEGCLFYYGKLIPQCKSKQSAFDFMSLIFELLFFVNKKHGLILHSFITSSSKSVKSTSQKTGFSRYDVLEVISEYVNIRSKS
jgi:hypothetical protein